MTEIDLSSCCNVLLQLGKRLVVLVAQDEDGDGFVFCFSFLSLSFFFVCFILSFFFNSLVFYCIIYFTGSKQRGKG